MNKRIKNMWVNALRSGKYRQGFGSLAYAYDGQPLSCCALGVLCELAAEAGVVEKFGGHPDGMLMYGQIKESKLPPPEVCEWAGLDNENPAMWVDPNDGDNDDVIELSELNDRERRPFAEIATIIEEQM